LCSDVDVDVDDDAVLPDFCGNSIFGEKRCGEMVLRRMLISGVPGSNPRGRFHKHFTAAEKSGTCTIKLFMTIIYGFS
jgi:hypothetical protein